LPGFVRVGVVVLVEVEVEVLVMVDVEVVVGVVVELVIVDVEVVVGVVVEDVIVDVEVVVGVVVVVVVVDVLYWSAWAELRLADVAYPMPPSPTNGTKTPNVASATTAIRRFTRTSLNPTPGFELESAAGFSPPDYPSLIDPQVRVNAGERRRGRC